jgi:signal transduction histidine kinase
MTETDAEPRRAPAEALAADHGGPDPSLDASAALAGRYDPNLTRGVGGTGLGLYICRELVRHMNGRVWVVSAEWEGSTFFFELPLAEP